MSAVTVHPFKSYLYKEIDCSIYQLNSQRLLDRYNNHLEYFPIVNQRVFKIGSTSSGADTEHGKDILNVQFKKTYKRFLHLLVHQNVEDGKSDLDLCLKLRL